jgi:hypothetical protein
MKAAEVALIEAKRKPARGVRRLRKEAVRAIPKEKGA